MVRISAKQEQLLRALADKKSTYDKEIIVEEARFRERKDALKRTLAGEIQSALAEGIPARQVAIKGLGYVDVRSLNQFLNAAESATTAGARFDVPVEPEFSGPITLVLKNEEKDIWSVMRGSREIAEVGIVPNVEEGGPYFVLNREVDSLPDAEEIRAAINDYFREPGVVWD